MFNFHNQSDQRIIAIIEKETISLLMELRILKSTSMKGIKLYLIFIENFIKNIRSEKVRDKDQY